MKKLYINAVAGLALSTFAGGAFFYPINQDQAEEIVVEIENSDKTNFYFEVVNNKTDILPEKIEEEKGGSLTISGVAATYTINKGASEKVEPDIIEEPVKIEPSTTKEEPVKVESNTTKKEPAKTEPNTKKEEPVKTVPVKKTETENKEAETTNKETVKNRSVKVGNISVNVSASVSEKDYNTFIGWVENMPKMLKENINSISVVDDIESYNSFYNYAVAGLTKGGKDIYIKSQSLTSRKGTLYHEAAHCLDYAGGYSNTSFWADITSKEWKNENHYSVENEAFAEAVSRYFIDGLSKEESKKAIKNLVENGVFGVADEKTDITLYAKNRCLWVYSGPDDFYNAQLGTIEIGSNIQAVSINADQTWYKVNYGGVDGYIRADMVSLEA